jgi:hypothetical protein
MYHVYTRCISFIILALGRFVPKGKYDNSTVAYCYLRVCVCVRNTLEEEKCQADLLEVSYPDDVLVRRLLLFTIGARWIDGTKYPPGMLHNSLTALLRYTYERNLSIYTEFLGPEERTFQPP